MLAGITAVRFACLRVLIGAVSYAHNIFDDLLARKKKN